MALNAGLSSLEMESSDVTEVEAMLIMRAAMWRTKSSFIIGGLPR
jgi:hypothetical protein